MRDKHSRARFGSKAVRRSLAVTVKQTSRRACVRARPGKFHVQIRGGSEVARACERERQPDEANRWFAVTPQRRLYDGEQRARVCVCVTVKSVRV